MFYNMELSAGEIYALLNNGSSNQQEFIKLLTVREFEDLLEVLEESQLIQDLRGWINGGVLRAIPKQEIEDPETEINFIIYETEKVIIEVL